MSEIFADDDELPDEPVADVGLLDWDWLNPEAEGSMDCLDREVVVDEGGGSIAGRCSSVSGIIDTSFLSNYSFLGRIGLETSSRRLSGS